MQRNREKPLYRKVNTKAANVHHGFGKDFKNSRNTKKSSGNKMKQGVKRGLDYTPLYKYLLKQVGGNWDEIYSKIKSRILDDDCIWYMVAKNKEEASETCGISESTYFSGLFINEQGILEITNPDLNI